MDARLPLLARLALRNHLRRCPACTRCDRQFRHLRAILRRWKT
jgi:anti-sigma factor RsiW